MSRPRPRSSRRRLPVVVAMFSAVALTASAVIASAAGGQQAIGDTSAPFPGTAADSSTATGDCSKLEAGEAVKRLRLGHPELADPVYKVLCGAFAGPASQTMVVSLLGPGSLGMIDWVVFRWGQGEWQLLMRRHQAAVLTAAGSDIRETVFVFRPGDPRCCPSGGTRSRIWHWNGSRLVAGDWKQAKPPTKPPPARQPGSPWPGFGHFKSPSRNIVCVYNTRGAPAAIECGIRTGLKPMPPYTAECRRLGLDHNADRIGLTAGGGRPRPRSCSGDAGPFVGAEAAPVLGYGKTWSGRGLSCRSALSGMTCRNRRGHGFFLSRTRWRTF
jgi:hypothetical protein